MTKKTIIQQQMERIASKVGGRAPASRAPKASAGRAPRPPMNERVTPAPNVVVLEGGKAKPFIATPELVASARKRLAPKPTEERTKDSAFNPFKFPEFPKSVTESVDRVLANDSALAAVADWGTAAWQGSTYYGSAFFEGQTFLGYAYQSQLSQRPEYRKISGRTALDMTRKWIKLLATGDTDTGAKAERISVIQDELKRLNAQDKFRELAEGDGYFGRMHLFFDFEDEDPKELESSIGDGLSAATALKVSKAHPLKGIRTVEPIWAYPMGYNATNPLAADWYRPQKWNVMGNMVHRSRLLPIVSREVPDMLKPAYAFGGLSLSQMAKPYIDNWLRTQQSVSDLLHSFSINGLATDMSVSTQPGGSQLFNRIDLFNLLRDNRGAFVIDKNTEEWFQHNTPLGTLDALQAQAQEHMASVVNMPIVILLGIAPHGLNASSEGEIRVWYDYIAAMQKKIFSDPLTRLINFIQLSKFGNVDPKITFEFEPLWAMTEKEESEVEKNQAETDAKYVDAGVLHPIEVRGAIAANPGSRYPSLAVDNVPEPPAENDEGGPGAPGGEDPDGGGPDGGKSPFEGGTDAAFNEADHPRDHGKFTSGGGSGASNFGSEISLKGAKKVGKQMGSNEGGVYETPAGERYYVKKGQTKDHVTNELTAAALYDLAGFPTLKYRPVEGGTHIATEMAKLEKNNVSKLSADERKEAQKAFATHAWLSNWDAAGTGGDNQGVVNGKVTTLDVGGSLAYRAQGGEKGKAFGNEVSELDTLRNKSMNYDAARLYGEMSEADMRASAEHVTKIPDEKIKAAVEASGAKPALAEKLIARKKDIAQRFGLATDESKFDESKVKRDEGGKFSSTGGGGGGSSVKEVDEVVSGLAPKDEGKPAFMKLYVGGEVSKENHVKTVDKVISGPVKTGANYRSLLKALINDTPTHFDGEAAASMKKDLTNKLAQSYLKSADELAAQAQASTDDKVKADLHNKAEKALQTAKKLIPSLNLAAKPAAPKAEAKPAPKKAEPKPEPAPEPKAPESTISSKIEAQMKANVGATKLNDDHSAKEKVKAAVQVGASLEDLEKVLTPAEKSSIENGYHKSVEKMFAKSQQYAAAEKANKEAAEQQAKAKAEQAAKDKAAKEQAKAELKAYADSLGLKDEADLVAFQGLTQMLGGGSTDEMLKKFKQFESKAKKAGLDALEGFEAAMLVAYTGSAFSAVNANLRKGSWTAQQHVYVNVVNRALKKLPSYEGKTTRGAHLNSEQQGLYTVGNVVEERAFTSTSKASGFGGNTRYTITGKSGRDVQKISNYQSEEAEVLYPARTFFRVTKVDGKPGGEMHVHMEEVEAW